jgi:hypothetical protein
MGTVLDFTTEMLGSKIATRKPCCCAVRGV